MYVPYISAVVTDMLLTLTMPTTVTSIEPFKPANLTPLNWFEKQPHFTTVVAASEQKSDSVQGQVYEGAIPIHINRIDPVSNIQYYINLLFTQVGHVALLIQTSPNKINKFDAYGWHAKARAQVLSTVCCTVTEKCNL